MALSKAEGLRCASSFVTAAYFYSTPHSSGIARLASGSFFFAVSFQLSTMMSRSFLLHHNRGSSEDNFFGDGK
jgi:hypothetical protein